MTKKYLISFASPDLKRSAQRFYEQANNMIFYDQVKVFSMLDLDSKHQKLYLIILKIKEIKNQVMDTHIGSH